MDCYLYVTPFFPAPDDWRGAYCLDFVKAVMRTKRYAIRVFVPGCGSDYEIDGVKVSRFPAKSLPSGVLPLFFRKENDSSFLAAVKRAGVVLESVAVCHVHTARLAPYALAIKKLQPMCLTLLHHHDLCSFGLNLGILHKSFFYNAWLFCQFRRLFEQIDRHIFISDASRKSFLAAPNTNWTDYADYKAQMRGPAFFHCRPVRIKSSTVLHNGVDTKVFRPISRQPSVIRPVFTIGCVGNFTDLKDQATLIRAVGMLGADDEGLNGVTEINVTFVGSGTRLAACRELAESVRAVCPTPLSVTFLNEVPHGQLADFYRALDLFVLPSVFEGFGCVYTEAWACGVPFIACEGQGTDDLIFEEDREKWLCRPHDAEDLAKKIGAFIRNRWTQRLAGPIDIDTLVGELLDKI